MARQQEEVVVKKVMILCDMRDCGQKIELVNPSHLTANEWYAIEWQQGGPHQDRARGDFCCFDHMVMEMNYIQRDRTTPQEEEVVELEEEGPPEWQRPVPPPPVDMTIPPVFGQLPREGGT